MEVAGVVFFLEQEQFQGGDVRDGEAGFKPVGQWLAGKGGESRGGHGGVAAHAFEEDGELELREGGDGCGEIRFEESFPDVRGARKIGGLEFSAFGFEPEGGLMGIEEREGIEGDGCENWRRVDEVEVRVHASERDVRGQVVCDGGVEFEIDVGEGMAKLIEGALGEIVGAFAGFLLDPAAVARDEVEAEKEKREEGKDEEGDARGREEAAEAVRLNFARRSHG